MWTRGVPSTSAPAPPSQQLLNKVDLLSEEQLAELKEWYQANCKADAVFAISALEVSWGCQAVRGQVVAGCAGSMLVGIHMPCSGQARCFADESACLRSSCRPASPLPCRATGLSRCGIGLCPSCQSHPPCTPRYGRSRQACQCQLRLEGPAPLLSVAHLAV